MAQLRFYKTAEQPTQNLAAGAVWFNTTLKTIEVYNGTAWEKFAGKLTDANWNTSTQRLTINKADGSSIELDFSNIASLSGVQAALSELETNLQNNIDAVEQLVITAQSTADDAVAAVGAEQGRAEGVEQGLQSQINAMDTAYKAADSGLSGRISTLESTIQGLNGTLHFRGVTDTAPADPERGDFYITNAGAEYIYDGTKWEKIGDTSAESAAISALEGRMGTAESDITALETFRDTTAPATYVAKSEYNTKVQALEQADSTNTTAIETEKSRAQAAEGALSAKINKEITDRDTAIQSAITAALAWEIFE